MNYDKITDLREVAKKQSALAESYMTSRRKAGKAKVEFELILVANLPSIRKEKKNVGYELACLMLMERNESAKDLYKTWQEEESYYKGCERLLDAHANKISFEQSIMKYQREGEKYGC